MAGNFHLVVRRTMLLSIDISIYSHILLCRSMYIFPRRLQSWRPTPHSLQSVRSALGSTDAQSHSIVIFSAQVAQAYELVRLKAIFPGSLAASLEHTIGGRKAFSQLSCTLRDAVVILGMCSHGEYTSEEAFVEALDPGFDGEVRSDADLKSQLLNSYHHVKRALANHFRSICSKTGWRPRKGTRANEQTQTDGETAAWDPAGWTGAPNVDAQEFNPGFMPPYYWPFQPVYDAAYAWQNALSDARCPEVYLPSFYRQRDPAWDSLPLPMPMCIECGVECQGTSNDYSRCDRCWAAWSTLVIDEVSNVLRQHTSPINTPRAQFASWR